MIAIQNLPYILIMAASALIAGGISFYAWRRRKIRGGGYFSLLMLMVAEWAVANGGELASLTLEGKIWWSKISYLGIATVGPLWLLFALDYSHEQAWLKSKRTVWLWVVPGFTLVLVFTNELHGWIWPDFTPTSNRPGDMLIYGHGWAFWLNAVYVYLMLLSGSILLIRATIHSPRLYRQQVMIMVVAVLIPWISNMIYISGSSPVPGLELTPIALTLSGLLIAWAIFRLQMLELVPVARDLLIESMDDGVLVLDELNRIVDANPTVYRLVERSPEKTIGRPVEEVFDNWSDLVARYRDTPRARAEIQVGQTRWLDLLITPIYDRDTLTGRLVVLRDISERKQAEIRLEDYMRELEARNAELDAFAHTVAHDLKTPLAVLISSSELLQKGKNDLGENQFENILGALSRASLKMSNIIDELLLLASVRKTDSVPVQIIDMGKIVANALEALKPMISERQALIIQPETWPQINSYGPWLEQVWINYLSNAIKYGGEPPVVELGYNELPKSGEDDTLFCFWVKDNGPGLTAEQQRLLFIEFSRLSQLRIKGHGLGLSIARRIIEKLKGQVGVESQVGQGSKFYFTLPVG